MKILATDFDGTLARDNVNITDEDIQAILEWKRKGNLFGIVSGRPYQRIMSGIDNYPLTIDFAVAYNGALVYNKEGEVIHRSLIENSILEELKRYLVTYSFEMLGVGNDEYLQLLDYDDESAYYQRVKDEYQYVDDINYATNIIVFAKNKEDKEAIVNYVEKNYHGVLSTHSNSDCFMNISSAEVNKKNGMKVVCNYLKIDDKNVSVIGDAFNDISMVEYFGGYAVANAVGELRDVAVATVHDFSEMFDLIEGM